MRKVIFCFIAIVLILTLGSTGLTQGLPSLTESNLPSVPNPLTTTSVPVSSPSVFSYSDPTCSFNFNYPSTWKPYEEIDDTGSCKAVFDLFDGDYNIAAFSVYVENYESSLSSYIMSVEEWMLDPQNMPEYQKINEEAVTIKSLPAIKRLYTWTEIQKNDNSKIPIKAVDVYLVEEKKGYILEGKVVQDQFDKILPELEIMFNSFTISGITSEPTTFESGLPSVTITSETPSSSTTTPTTEEITFKFCPYCGTPLQPNYQFCSGCGKPISVQRTIKATKKEGVRSGNQTNIDYPVNLMQTRGFSEEINPSDYPRGMNKSFNKPFKYFKSVLISRGFGLKLAHIFPEKPLLPWAISRRITLGNYANLFPDSLGRKISSPRLVIRNAYSTNFNFSYIKRLGKEIAFNPSLNKVFRGGGINQLGSPIRNLGEGIISPMIVSRAPLSGKTWVLRSSKRGVEENIPLGSSIEKLSSKIGSSIIKQTRSSSFLGGCFSTLGQGISSEVGIKREAETLPSLAPVAPQTVSQITPTIPGTPPPATGPEGIVSPTPGTLAQGRITLTPPGQPVPAQPGPGGIVLPTPNTLQEPQIIWKQYSLSQSFSNDSLITGYLEYPSTWLVNLDSFNKNVTFSEDASGLTSLTLFPGITGQFSSAQDLAQQIAYLLQQQVPDLSILNQEFKILPTPGSGAIEMTSGRVSLQGNYQGTALRFNLETHLIYMGAYVPMNGMGYAILTKAPPGIFIDKEQKYFNRMILSYKRAVGEI
jgi:hypothetical protein